MKGWKLGSSKAYMVTTRELKMEDAWIFCNVIEIF
jgi:hypothetical protein